MRDLYALKPWYTARLSAVVRVATARQLSPDLFTWVGVGCAAAAALAIWSAAPIAAGVLLAGRLAGANLDGAVARARGVNRPWGFVVNEIGDRASDLLLFAGLGALAVRSAVHGATTELVFVAAAAVAGGLPTFVSLATAGAGAGRRNGGPIGKTERCAFGVVAAAEPHWLPAICALIVVGSVFTAGVRLTGARRVLRAAVPS